MAYGPEGKEGVGVLGGWAGPQDPLPLRDGRYLRTTVSVHVDYETNLLKVLKSSFQYQEDQSNKRWLFRYDYVREGDDPHPAAHIQIKGRLERDEVLDGIPLSHIHFPTGRVPMEAVIRLLVEQFGVPCKEDAGIWRPVLAEAERAFLEIAHTPLSGPIE